MPNSWQSKASKQSSTCPQRQPCHQLPRQLVSQPLHQLQGCCRPQHQLQPLHQLQRCCRPQRQLQPLHQLQGCACRPQHHIQGWSKHPTHSQAHNQLHTVRAPTEPTLTAYPWWSANPTPANVRSPLPYHQTMSTSTVERIMKPHSTATPPTFSQPSGPQSHNYVARQ